MIKYFFLVTTLVLLFSCKHSGKLQQAPVNTTEIKQVRILSYNIHHANPPSKKDIIDIDAIATVINNSKADIVALQEVDKNTGRCGKQDQADILAEKTGMQYAFFKAIDYDGGEYGLAILSRYPLKNTHLVTLPQQVKAEERILAYATINVNGTDVILANTHLDALRTDSNRVVQVQRILQTFAAEKLPVILCGDFNNVATAETIKLLDTQFNRTCIDNCPGTIPQTNPTRTIDYIAFKNLRWKLISHEVIAETYASDHRPVLAVFEN